MQLDWSEQFEEECSDILIILLKAFMKSEEEFHATMFKLALEVKTDLQHLEDVRTHIHNSNSKLQDRLANIGKFCQKLHEIQVAKNDSKASDVSEI